MGETRNNYRRVRGLSIIDFCHDFLDFSPYKYQAKFLVGCMRYNRIAGLWCRQSGKSTCVSIYALYRAVSNDNISIMIVAPTQNQSAELFFKLRMFAEGSEFIRDFIKSSSQTEIIFKNNSRVRALPCGPEGITIRGYTAQIIVIEEASYIKDKIVNEVIIPMIAAQKDGQIIKIGTPWLKNHFFNSCYGRETNYKLFHISWKDAVQENQLSKKFIREQKDNLTMSEFKTEYEAEFVEDSDAYFKQSLISSCVEDYPIIENLK